MKAFKQAFRFFAWGMLIGAVVATATMHLVVPAIHALPAAMCDCSELVESILSTVRNVQIGGLIAGGVAGLALWIVLRRTGKLKTPI
jgi:hypothetical protein